MGVPCGRRRGRRAGAGEPAGRRPGSRRGRAGAPGLRPGYRGYCPLPAELPPPGGGATGVPALLVERRPLAAVGAEAFFEGFVRARRPLVLEAREARGGPLAALLGLRGAAARWAKAGDEGTAALREGPAGECVVAVERRAGPSAPFGRLDAAARRSTTLAEFCRELEAGGELGYLTTQPLPEDADGCPVALAAAHVLRLLGGARRLRPKLVGALAPVQYNLWFGRAAEGATSGLHHDFHDNLYVLLRGRKEFRLFSPRCVDILQPAGASRRRPRLHANGLLCYAPGIRDDGAPEAVVRAWRQKGSNTRSAGAGGDSEEEERLLEMALDREGPESEAEEEGQGLGARASGGLPDSFCQVSTVTADGALPVPAPLEGRHLTAKLEAGDLLYLPASWFHEVISRGTGAGGHLALNLWLAPPHTGGTMGSPYEDGFWEAKYRSLRRLARTEQRGHAGRRRRPPGRRGAVLSGADGVRAPGSEAAPDTGAAAGAGVRGGCAAIPARAKKRRRQVASAEGP